MFLDPLLLVYCAFLLLIKSFIRRLIATRVSLAAHSAVLLKAESMADKVEWLNKLSKVIQPSTGPVKGGPDGTPGMRQSRSDGSLVSYLILFPSPPSFLHFISISNVFFFSGFCDYLFLNYFDCIRVPMEMHIKSVISVLVHFLILELYLNFFFLVTYRIQCLEDLLILKKNFDGCLKKFVVMLKLY